MVMGELFGYAEQTSEARGWQNFKHFVQKLLYKSVLTMIHQFIYFYHFTLPPQLYLLFSSEH